MIEAGRTGLDPEAMELLPDTGDRPADIVVQAAHRNPYDHLVRASGARLVAFGDPDGATVEAFADVLAARLARTTHRVELAQARAHLLTTLGIEVR